MNEEAVKAERNEQEQRNEKDGKEEIEKESQMLPGCGLAERGPT